MALQFSTGVRNALLDAIESTIGTTAVLKIFSGSMPANCGTADSGTLLVSYTLASDWAANASAGAKGFNNLPLTVAAAAAGSAGYFRVYPSTPTTTNAGIQGTVTATGGGGDMTIDNIVIASGQTINVTAFTLTAPGA